MTTKKETRGRKRKFDLDVALAEAQRQFHAHGYEGAKLGEICAALGITQTSLYAAFDSKIGLFEKVVARYAETTGAFVADALAEAKTPSDVWSGVLSRAADTYGRPAAPGCLVLGTDVSTTDPGARSILADRVRRTEAAICSRLVDLGSAEAAGEAHAIVTLLRGLSGAARAGADPEELHGTIDRLLSGSGVPARE